jgi:tRNA nucleotidyltransferase (CCA-adding enzyme)
MNEKDIEKQVSNKITPTLELRKEIEEIVKEIEKKLYKEITERKIPASVELVGSIAKDTFLKNNMDIDLFILFPKKIQKEKIAKNTLEIGKKILKNAEESYAEHPYIRGYFKNYKIEIVPCYKIENAKQKISAVDRTPLHTKYIKEKILEKQKHEVRLLKQFLKGIGCYGAEAEIEGFSGYLCEILIIKYGNFRELIKHAQNWKHGEKLTLTKENYHDFDTPLIFIDPVDSNRNVASALSKEKFELFVKTCKEYLRKPSIFFFFPKKIKPWSLEKIHETIKKQKYQYLGVKIAKPDIIDENLYPQIRKTIRSLWSTCKRYDFTIYDITFHIDDEEKNVFIIIKAKDEILKETTIHRGPPTDLRKNKEMFIKRWENDPRVVNKPYEKDGRLYTEIKRSYTNINKFIADQFKDLSLGKNIDEAVKKKFEILNSEDLLIDNLRTFWTIYLDEKKSWER